MQSYKNEALSAKCINKIWVVKLQNFTDFELSKMLRFISFKKILPLKIKTNKG